MQNCIAVDWLQLYVTVASGAFESKVPFSGYEVTKMDYTTQQYRDVYVVTKANGEEVATLVCNPFSSILDANGGLLKFANRELYRSDLRQFVESFLDEFRLSFRSISRMDVAVDFLSFEGSRCPESLIRSFVAGDFVKIGRASKFGLRGDTGKGELGSEFAKATRAEKKARQAKAWAPTMAYLEFGSKTSDVRYYLYDKTKEMREVKEKPWVVDHWKSAGWDGSGRVWRLEFSIKNNTKGIIEVGEKQVLSMKDLSIVEGMAPALAWGHYFNHYFQFFRNRGESRKDRMQRLTLLSGFEFYTVSIKLSNKKDSGRSAKIFTKKLIEYTAEASGDVQLRQIGYDFIRAYVASRGLGAWASAKFGAKVESMLGDDCFAGLLVPLERAQGVLFDPHSNPGEAPDVMRQRVRAERAEMYSRGWHSFAVA